MTYKRADRPGWPRLRAQRFICQRIADGRVNGYATLLRMLEVAEPLWVPHHDQRVCIADAGFAWLQLFPEGANYTHTTMFDADGQPVQEYIDLVAEQGVGEDGIPWYDDLYLDIAWIPEGTPVLLDQEELEAAHASGAITDEQYELARGETARLLVAVALGDYTLPEVTRACYPALKAAMEVAEISGEAPLPVVTLAASTETANNQEAPPEIAKNVEIADAEIATDNAEQPEPVEPSEQSEPVESAAQPAEDGEQDA
jgi:predicted RNA-binding protein associated with RNAse of E/G family